ncbi:MAG: GAF domain-containing protein [Desulfovibrionaceae bacterium]|nr:GAF domain-containing protein [Desulfovibrionaceae bacterium]
MAQDYFSALRDVVLVISSSLEPRDVLHKITEQTARTMGCKASTIRLLDRSGHFLLPSAAYGLSDAYMRKGAVEVKKSGMDGEVLAGKIMHLKDAAADGRFQYPESAKAEGLVSVLSAPLMVDGRAIGLIRVYSAEEREFSEAEHAFMDAVAAISAVAIENARLHAQLRSNYELMTRHAYQIYED